MTRLRSVEAAALPLLIIAVGLLTSCGDDKSTNTGGEDLPRQTAEGLIQQYSESFEAANLEDYTDCLDGAYKFIFTPQDAEDLELPQDEPWWLLADDLASTEAMFDHDDLHLIQFDLTVVDQDTADVGGDPVITIKMDPAILVVLIPQGEEPYYLDVTETWLYFSLVPDAADDRLWKLASIEEEPKVEPAVSSGGSQGRATEHLTFGDIKAIFR
jgi:hypothetical protein